MKRACLVALVVLPFLYGCGGLPTDGLSLLEALGIPIPPDDAWAFESVAGGADGKVVLGQMTTPNPLTDWDLWATYQNPEAAGDGVGLSIVYPRLTGLVRVDLNTLATEPIALPPAPDQGVISVVKSSGHWLSWMEASISPALFVPEFHSKIQVRDLNTGAERTLLDATGMADIYGFIGDRLVAGIASNAAHEDYDREVRIYDLVAGTETVLGTYASSMQLVDDELVYVDFDSINNSETASAALIAVDLSTGAKRTVVAALPPDVYDFVPVPGAIAWSQYSDTRFVVGTVDLATGAVTQVAELPQDAAIYNTLLAAGAQGMVVQSSTDLSPTPTSIFDWKALREVRTHEQYLWVNLDGTTQTLLEYEESFDAPAYYDATPAVIGNTVLLRDPRTGDWIAYDVTTRTQQTFSVFD